MEKWTVAGMPSQARAFRLTHPRYSEDRLRPFVKVVGPWLRGTPPVEPQTQGGGRPRNRVDRPTGDFRVPGQPAGRKDLTPPGVCTDDAGLRPWVSRRCRPGRGAPPVWLRCVLVQGEVCSGTVVVEDLVAQQATQVGVVQHHDVVETLTAEGADQTFRVRILPGD